MTPTERRNLTFLTVVVLLALAFANSQGYLSGILSLSHPPIPGDGFRVLILEQTSDRHKLPAKQVTAMLSHKPYLNAKCAKVDDTPEWRMVDVDSDMEFASDLWTQAHAKAKSDSGFDESGKLDAPWLIVSNGRAGTSQPFPADADTYLEILQKYGGK